MVDTPSNSKKVRRVESGNSLGARPKEQKPKIEAVVVTPGVRKQKKLSGLFSGQDFSDVVNYVARDVVLPMVKVMVVDSFSRGIERMVYGDAPARRGGTKYSYSGASRPSESLGFRPRETRPPQGLSHGAIEVQVETKEEAETVVERLGDLIEMYRVATVGDLFNLTGLPTSYTDENFGWDSIRGIRMVQNRDGYIIRLPRQQPL
jgi:hypothetical protein